MTTFLPAFMCVLFSSLAPFVGEPEGNHSAGWLLESHAARLADLPGLFTVTKSPGRAPDTTLSKEIGATRFG
jgi:hypothetical protein